MYLFRIGPGTAAGSFLGARHVAFVSVSHRINALHASLTYVIVDGLGLEVLACVEVKVA